MAWFIIQTERKTWTKYLVEADDAEEACWERVDDWRYLGYVDGEDYETKVVAGPFHSDLAALADEETYVDG